MIAAGATVRWSKGIAMFKIRTTVRGTTGFAVVSTGLATTSIPLPGFTHSFKTLTHLFAFLLTHVVPSLPHGGTP